MEHHNNTMMKGCSNLMAVLVIGAAAAVPSKAYAQPIDQPASRSVSDAASRNDGLEEIIVTAQRKNENLQDVPISVAAIGGAALAARGVTQVADLGGTIPGLVIGKGSGTMQPFLRGIGNLSTALGNESSVALYMDGVFFSRLPPALFSLSNVERIEVLKGPQGTLFGRNSSGGVIQVITKDPSHDFSGRATLGYGRFDTTEGTLYVTGGLSETLAADLSISGKYQKDGYGVNLTTGNKTGFENYFSARSKFVFDPGDDTKITLAGFYAYNRQNVAGNVYPGTTHGYESLPFAPAPLQPVSFWDDNRDLDSRSQAQMVGASLKIEQEMPFAKLTSISAISRTVHQLIDNDGDNSPRNDTDVDQKGHVRTISQELQLSSLPDDRLSWVAGLYYYNAKSVYDYITFRSPSGNTLPSSVQAGGTGLYIAGVDATSVQNAKSYAGYGQITYELMDRLKVTAGVRYTHDDTSARGSILFGVITRVAQGLPPLELAGAPNQVKVNKLTYKAVLDYQLTDDVLAYLSYSKGYKAGIFNLLTYNRIPNKPELVDAYEVGVKSDLFDRRLRLNVAAWWMDLKNPQVQIGLAGLTFFSNAGGARSKGIEADATLALAKGLVARASAAYTDARYTDYANAVCQPLNPNPPYGRIRPTVVCNATGNYLPRAPKFTSNVGFDYQIESRSGDIYLTFDWQHSSGYYFQPSNDLHQKSFEILNAQVKYQPTENLGVVVWGKNLTSAKYTHRADEVPGPTGSTYTPAAPVTYGLTVELDF